MPQDTTPRKLPKNWHKLPFEEIEARTNPQPRIYPKDKPKEFAEFCAYCAQDVRVEREVHKALAPAFELTGESLATFQLDIAINARGLPVNIDGLRKAQTIIDAETDKLTKDFQALTGFMPTQGEVFLAWLQARGFDGANLQAGTLDDAIEKMDTSGMPLEAQQALLIKKRISYASIKKVPSMLKCAGPHDNRVRGSIQYHTATTGRWGGKLIQPQNFKRPTIADTEQAYADLCNGASAEYLELCYGPPLEVISSCIRHFIHDTCFGEDGSEWPMLSADYAAIEARVVCWLAGQADALQEYRDGVDRYVKMASLIYGVKPENVNKHPQRFVGKQATLGCGFGMGPAKFRATCEKYRYYDLPHGLEEKAVKAFRDSHREVVKLWYASERAAKQAILNKGTAYKAGKLSFFCLDVAKTPFLFLKLPSGRKLAYPHPQINGDRLSFWGQRQDSVHWGRNETYGGKLVENATQAVAADGMSCGAQNVEAAGYEIATLIHDEALSYYRPSGLQTIEEFTTLLTKLPSWADGLPVEAEGKIVPFYLK